MNALSSTELHNLLVSATLPSVVILDCRSQQERATGQIAGSVQVSPAHPEAATSGLDKSAMIVAYCAQGRRSEALVRTLRELGFKNAYSLRNGLRDWVQNGFSLLQAEAPNPDWERYATQMKLSQVGVAGQAKIRTARVLLIGLGGLGSPIALYLAGAGVGRLGLVDGDQVDLTNLHRQILHSEAFVSKPKVDSAHQRLGGLNSQTEVLTYETRLNADNARSLIADFDFVIDATDNFESRYAINDACRRLNKPYVHGSVLGFNGQFCTFTVGSGSACYRCLYPHQPPTELCAPCAGAGVLGPVVGVIACQMATEALKLILELTPSATFLNTWDGLSNSFARYEVPHDPACPSCRV